jgi:cob(I)alamin adenosyltransferase
MKIYTKTGDDGTTALFGAGRVAKHHPRIEAYGTADEANSVIGLVLAQLPSEAEACRSLLNQVQYDLFVVGGDLATPEDGAYPVPRVTEIMVQTLEDAIDKYEADLPPLKNFILPAGHEASATLHIARTVCRRAERAVTTLNEYERINIAVGHYLNRLSDLLFVLARWVNHQTQTPETPWIPIPRKSH